jgi:HEAT repeat protein
MGGRWAVGLVTYVLIAAACDRQGASDYRVEIDLGPSIAALASDDLDVSSPAEDRVVALGDDAVPALRAALEREGPPVRLAVVEALALMGGESVADVLVRTMRTDPSEQVRAEAAFALRQFRTPSLDEALGAALRDPGAGVRRQAATACGAVCRTPANVQALAALALGDPESQVWWAARAALVRLRSRDDGALEAAVDSSVQAVAPAALAGEKAARAARAALLLADVGDARGAVVLVGLAAGPGDVTMRQQAVIALGAVGDASATPVLEAAAEVPQLKVLATLALARLRSRGVAESSPPPGRP